MDPTPAHLPPSNRSISIGDAPSAASRTSPDDAAALLDFVRDRDVPCPRCGYNTRALTAPRCPECGIDLKLSLAATEPFKRAWAAAVVGSALPAGIGVLFVGLTLMHGPPPFRRGAAEMLAYLVPMACIPVLISLLLLRRRFVRWTSAVQRWIAVAVWMVALSLFVFVIGWIR